MRFECTVIYNEGTERWHIEIPGEEITISGYEYLQQQKDLYAWYILTHLSDVVTPSTDVGDGIFKMEVDIAWETLQSYAKSKR